VHYCLRLECKSVRQIFEADLEFAAANPAHDKSLLERHFTEALRRDRTLAVVGLTVLAPIGNARYAAGRDQVGNQLFYVREWSRRNRRHRN